MTKVELETLKGLRDETKQAQELKADNPNRLKLIRTIWHKAQSEWYRLDVEQSKDAKTVGTTFQALMFRVSEESKRINAVDSIYVDDTLSSIYEDLDKAIEEATQKPAA